MAKLVVNEDMCISCGMCAQLDPEHFDMKDNGLSTAISQENLDSADLQSAKEGCPVGAISISECGNEECTCEKCEGHCEQ